MKPNDEEIEDKIKYQLNKIAYHEQRLKQLLSNQNRVTVSVTDKRYLKLQMIADSVDVDVETLLYIALDDYERKIEKFDDQHKADHQTFKL